MTSTVTMRNVVYGGTLINSTYNHNIAGGLVGWTDRSTVILDNCFFTGSYTGSVEAFSPILIQNPQIDSLYHDGMNVTYSDVYYTVDPSVTFDEHTIGQHVINDTVSRRVFPGIPENTIYEYIPSPDGFDYHVPCTVSGVDANYLEYEDLEYTVKNFNGETLTDAYYTFSLTKNGVSYEDIAGDGVYTLTLTGKNGYTGTYTKTIHVYPDDEIPYIDLDGVEQTADSFDVVRSDTDVWSEKWYNDGWFAVLGNVTIDDTISVSGDVKLILCDGATLRVNGGIGTGTGASLTIFAQSGGTGAIIASGSEYCAGIGYYKVDAFDYRNCGDIVINGGVITATGGSGCAGIGGGPDGFSGSVTVNRGTVTAYGDSGSPGIGETDSVTISGGTVTAYGGSGGAGIGGGWAEGCGSITISGGTVTGYGGDPNGAGIGGGRGGSGGSITINGGFVRAYGGPLEDIPTAKYTDIGVDRGDCDIYLNYTEDSAPGMNVSAVYWRGNVKIEKVFYDEDTLERFDVTQNGDTSALAGKTLVPAGKYSVVSFNCGSGSGQMPEVPVITGGEYTLPESAFTAPSQLRPFTGWSVKIGDGSAELMQPGDTIAVTADTEVTARFLTAYMSLQTLIDNAENGATITLDEDYVSESDEDTVFVIPAGKTLTIDLNGHTIDRGLANTAAGANCNVFSVYGVLTIKDTSAEQTGTITGGNNSSAGGAIRVETGATLNLEGGTVTGNKSPNGGGIYNIGTLNVSGGTVSGNTAANSGGGIFNNTAGTLNLTGGTVTNNSAAANYHGGGIHTSGTLNVSGAPVVSGNTRGGAENNVGLYEGALINVVGELTRGAAIGVNKSRANSAASDMGVFTAGLPGNGTVDAFTADSADQHVLPSENGEASFYDTDIFYIAFAPYENGTLSVDSHYVRAGDHVGIVSTPDSGCRERSFTVKDEYGNSVRVTYGAKNWIDMPASNVTVTAVFEPYYLINVDKNIPHGTVDLTWVWAYAGEVVPLSATPDRNYRLTRWIVTDSNGDPVETSSDSFIMPASDVSVSAEFEEVPNPEGPVAYVDAAGNAMTPVTAYTTVGPNTRIDTTGWYVVKENVGVGRQLLSGDVNIILCDGVTLTVNYGIFIDNGASLTIWQQEGGTGGLRVENITIEEAPAIRGYGSGGLTINGGNIYAEGYHGGVSYYDAAGGAGISVEMLTINAGSVTAQGGVHAAGIGGGEQKGGGTVIINGGTVRATGGLDGAGIGGGNGGNGGTIVINGGTVDAVSGGSSSGIGGGYGGSGGNITINGGTVLASGYDGGAGIGGGYDASGGNITIRGGSVEARSYYNGNQPSYGIGAGSGSNDANIILSWTSAADSVFANSYGGTVHILAPFFDDEVVYYGVCEMTNGVSEDRDINGKTLHAAYLPGDVNGDGSVDLKDLYALKKIVSNNGEVGFSYSRNCDVNGDGDVDIKDVYALKKYIAG